MSIDGENTKEELFVKLEMWVKEGEDGGVTGVRYNYSLPKVDSDMVVELYQLLIETLCNEISTLEGSERLLNMDIEVDYEDDDATIT